MEKGKQRLPGVALLLLPLAVFGAYAALPLIPSGLIGIIAFVSSFGDDSWG